MRVTAAATPETRDRGEIDDLTLARAQRGDQAAARALVERYQRRVFALLSRMLGGRRALVEDLAQETFLRVFRALPGFQAAGPARLSTWILTIATRLALDELERPMPPSEPLSELLGDGAKAAGAAEARAAAPAVARAIGRLPPAYQAAFLLREVHELDYEEIAHALDVDVGTVKSRLSRARAALREALREVKP
jgi:RNA polymerase sigma-70 factor (ECF subfamily)